MVDTHFPIKYTDSYAGIWRFPKSWGYPQNHLPYYRIFHKPSSLGSIGVYWGLLGYTHDLGNLLIYIFFYFHLGVALLGPPGVMCSTLLARVEGLLGRPSVGVRIHHLPGFQSGHFKDHKVRINISTVVYSNYMKHYYYQNGSCNHFNDTIIIILTFLDIITYYDNYGCC